MVINSWIESKTGVKVMNQDGLRTCFFNIKVCSINLELATEIKMKCPICGSAMGKTVGLRERSHSGGNKVSSTLILEIEKERKFARTAVHVCKVCKNVQTFLVS